MPPVPSALSRVLRLCLLYQSARARMHPFVPTGRESPATQAIESAWERRGQPATFGPLAPVPALNEGTAVERRPTTPVDCRPSDIPRGSWFLLSRSRQKLREGDSQRILRLRDFPWLPWLPPSESRSFSIPARRKSYRTATQYPRDSQWGCRSLLPPPWCGRPSR